MVQCLSGALITSAAPYRKVGRKGECCQIDLLLQAKRFVYIVEVKRQREIGSEVIDEVEQKRSRLKLPSGVTARTALVYDGHLAPLVEAEGYLIPSSRRSRCCINQDVSWGRRWL